MRHSSCNCDVRASNAILCAREGETQSTKATPRNTKLVRCEVSRRRESNDSNERVAVTAGAATQSRKLQRVKGDSTREC
jgi:hypothetical protein